MYVSVDITTYYKGYHGDLNETFFVGNVDEKYKKLVKNAWECLDQAIKEGQCKNMYMYLLYIYTLVQIFLFCHLLRLQVCDLWH